MLHLIISNVVVVVVGFKGIITAVLRFNNDRCCNGAAQFSIGYCRIRCRLVVAAATVVVKNNCCRIIGDIVVFL